MAQKKKVQKKASKKNNNKMLAAEIGAGVLAAAAAAGAGYYFYGTAKAPKHRRQAAKWANDMKKEVIKEAKKVQKLDRQAVAAIVDETAKAYQSVRSVRREDLVRAANELKQNWQKIEAELKPAGKVEKAAKKGRSKAKKAAKKVAKKVKKAAPKKASKKAAKKR
ncbi:hypothetical protein H0X32_00160 [Patescibacteria group bacterium]|nr:hypothetical protein [Patescibacteria group bacterium]